MTILDDLKAGRLVVVPPVSAEGCGCVTRCSGGCDNPDPEGEPARSAEPVAGPSYVVNCCNCGRIIDTREKDEGGDGFGAELSDERWVCSPECWDAVVDPAHPKEAPDV